MDGNDALNNDENVLAFDVPDHELERAAGVADDHAWTLNYCTCSCSLASRLSGRKRTLTDISRCPLCPQKRTSFGTAAMSALCQKRTHAMQQKISIGLPYSVRASSVVGTSSIYFWLFLE